MFDLLQHDLQIDCVVFTEQYIREQEPWHFSLHNQITVKAFLYDYSCINNTLYTANGVQKVMSADSKGGIQIHECNLLPDRTINSDLWLSANTVCSGTGINLRVQVRIWTQNLGSQLNRIATLHLWFSWSKLVIRCYKSWSKIIFFHILSNINIQQNFQSEFDCHI